MLNFFITFFLPSLPINFNVVSSNFKASIIFWLNDLGFPDSNNKPVLSLIIVSLDPPILLAIISDKTGFLFEAGKVESLSKKIIEVLQLDETTLKSLGNEGRKNVIKKFNIEKMCISTYSEYKKLIK